MLQRLKFGNAKYRDNHFLISRKIEIEQEKKLNRYYFFFFNKLITKLILLGLKKGNRAKRRVFAFIRRFSRADT